MSADTSDWVCRRCKCSDLAACPGGCFWIERNFCSACASADQVAAWAAEKPIPKDTPGPRPARPKPKVGRPRRKP